MKILIDNGHGKDTPGKRSPVWKNGTQLLEWEWARDIARRVYGGLTALGIQAVLLVTEEEDISLGERCKRANAYGKDSLFLSIHGNAMPQPNQASGWECYAYAPNTKADHAAWVFSHFAGACVCQPYGFKNRQVKYNDTFYVLKNTNMPAVLTENLFYDNEKDCEFMLSEKGRQAIADLHIQAVKSICESGILQR